MVGTDFFHVSCEFWCPESLSLCDWKTKAKDQELAPAYIIIKSCIDGQLKSLTGQDFVVWHMTGGRIESCFTTFGGGLLSPICTWWLYWDDDDDEEEEDDDDNDDDVEDDDDNDGWCARLYTHWQGYRSQNVKLTMTMNANYIDTWYRRFDWV
jgi:hypothetical protein